jgi:hypothetical protein
MMAAPDYRARADGIARGVPLLGTPLVASWNPSLREAMRIAVHEEAILEPLLTAVAGLR